LFVLNCLQIQQKCLFVGHIHVQYKKCKPDVNDKILALLHVNIKIYNQEAKWLLNCLYNYILFVLNCLLIQQKCLFVGHIHVQYKKCKPHVNDKILAILHD
jgi:hypothetical protein